MAITEAKNKAIQKVDSKKENAVAQTKKVFLFPSDGKTKAVSVQANDIDEANKLLTK